MSNTQDSQGETPNLYQQEDSMYYVNYHTGAGDEWVDGDIDEAKRIADDGAAYTQMSIAIEDAHGQVIAVRPWSGVINDSLDEMADPIRFGDYGYYGDWERR